VWALLRNSFKKIWIAGQGGMVGQSLVRALSSSAITLLETDRKTLDLRHQDAVKTWMSRHKPDAIFLAAATVGGIEANRTRPGEFLYDNLMIAANVIDAAAETGVEKLLYLGSSCIYPRDCAQPISESSLMTGPLEKTNEAYALAKITGIALCQSYRTQYGCNFISTMPCNLYGPGDRYDALQSHVIPALIMKFDDALRVGADHVTLWGTGTPLREFLYIDDLAKALIVMMNDYDGAMPLNIGSGVEISIANLAQMIADEIGYHGQIHFDASMPDGTPRKVLDSTNLRALGWAPSVDFHTGLRGAILDYRGRRVITHAA
jgi:GDP-L-fucose synthase